MQATTSRSVPVLNLMIPTEDSKRHSPVAIRNEAGSLMENLPTLTFPCFPTVRIEDRPEIAICIIDDYRYLSVLGA